MTPMTPALLFNRRTALALSSALLATGGFLVGCSPEPPTFKSTDITGATFAKNLKLIDHIAQASTHWMRHTSGSHLSEKADLKVVRDNLGHANISTTSIYLHSEDDARHDATNAVHRVGWATA